MAGQSRFGEMTADKFNDEIDRRIRGSIEQNLDLTLPEHRVTEEGPVDPRLQPKLGDLEKDCQRVTRDLLTEHLDPHDFDVLGIINDLRANATRPGDIDSAPDQTWTDALRNNRRSTNR